MSSGTEPQQRQRSPLPRSIYREVWSEPALGCAAYRIDTEPWSVDKLATELTVWLAQLGGAGPCLVRTATVTRDIAKSQVLSRAGFYPVGSRLVLMIDSAHADKLHQGVETRRLRLASSADLAGITDIGVRWNERHAGNPADPRIGATWAQQGFGLWLDMAWRRGARLYAYERFPQVRLDGFVLFEPMGARTVCLQCFAAAETPASAALAAELLGIATRRCFTRGSEIVKAQVPSADLESINTLFDLGFILDRAMTHWHRWLDVPQEKPCVAES